MALGNYNNSWYKELKNWEKDREQRVQQALENEKLGGPRVLRLDNPALRYDKSDVKTSKFLDKPTSVSRNATSKWRSKLVKDLPRKQYGRSYNDRLNNLLNEIGVPEHEREDFVRWLDAQEQGISTQAQKLRERPKYSVSEKPSTSTDMSIKTGKIESKEKRQNQPKKIEERTFFDNLKTFLRTLNPFEDDVSDEEFAAMIISQSDKIDKNPVLSELNRALTFATNSALLGLPEELDRRLNKGEPTYVFRQREREGVGAVADFLYNLAGLVTTGGAGAAALRGAGVTGAGMKELSRAAAKNQVSKDVLKRGITDSVKEGALVGGAMSLGESASRLGLNPESTTIEQELKNLGLNVGLGAVADTGLTGLGTLLKTSSSRSMQNMLNEQFGQALRNAPEPEVSKPRFNYQSQTGVALDDSFYNNKEVRDLLEYREQLLKDNAPDAELERMAVDQELLLREKDYAKLKSNTDTLTPLQKEIQNVIGLEPTLPRRYVTNKSLEEIKKTSFIDRAIKNKTDTRTKWIKYRESYSDDLAGVEWIDKQIAKMDLNNPEQTLNYLNPKTWIKSRQKQLAADSSLYRSLMNAKGAHSVASEHTYNRFGNFLKTINEQKINVEDLENYAFAKHGLSIYDKLADNKQQVDGLMEQLTKLYDDLGESAADSAEVRELKNMIKSYKDYTLPKGAERDILEMQVKLFEQDPKLVNAYKEFMQIQQQNLKDMYEGGLITKDLYEELKKNDTYIPMKRNFESTDDYLGIAGRKPQVPLARRKGGSEEMVKSPIQEAIRNAYITRFNIEKNKGLKVLHKFAKVDKEGTLIRRANQPNSSTVTVYEKGRPIYYEVPTALKNYIDNFNATRDPDSITKAIQKMAQLQRKLTTQYSLTFQLKSLLREPVQAIMTSRTNKNFIDGVYQTTLGYIDALMGEQLEQITKGRFKSFKKQYKEMGGVGYQFIRMSDEDLQRVAKEMYDSGTVKGNIRYLNPFRALGKFGEAVETGARLGEFRSAIRQGYSPEDAFFEATDITNYKRGGTVTRELNKYVPFLNATIQGNSRVIRAIQEAPARTVARGISMLTSTAIVAYAMRYMDGVSEEQRNELKNLSEWQKDSFLYIPDPREGVETIYAIPKAFAVGQMFMNPAERILDDYTNSVLDDPSVGDHIRTELKGLLKSFAPPNEVAGLTTIYELMMNKSLFTGFDIENRFDIEQGVPKREREAYDQSEIPRILSDLLNVGSEEGVVSPAQVDYVMKDLLGSVGTRALNLTDHLLSDTPPAKPVLDELLKPVNQFTLDPTQSGSVYENLQKLEREEERPDLRKLTKEEREEFYQEENYYNYLKRVKEINKEIQEIRNSDEPSDVKKRLIQRLRKEQDNINSQVIDYYNYLNN